MDTSSILIRRCTAEYLVSADLDRAWAIKTEFDEALARDLRSAIGESLKPIVRDSDPSVWLIRRLEVAVDVNSSWDRDVLARVWGAEIAAAQGAAMRGSTGSGNAICFPNRAAFLASFLVDASRDDAWSKWYFKEFEGLKMLPRSMAIRTALCETPNLGLEALTTIEGSDLRDVLRAMTTRDAHQVLIEISRSDSDPASQTCLQAISDEWQTSFPRDLSSSREVHDCLSIYLQVVRSQPSLAGTALKQLIEGVVRFVRCCLEIGPAKRVAMCEAVANGDLATLYREVGTADASIIAALQYTPLSTLQQFVEGGRAVSEAEIVENNISTQRHTSLGGVFLLLPLIDELPLDAATRGWPGIGVVSPTTLVRFLLVLKCCGAERLGRASSDLLLREILCIPPEISPALISDWGRGIRKDRIRQLGDVALRWQIDRGAVDGRTLIVNRVSTRGEPTAVIADARRGVWLGLVGCDPNRPGAFRTRVRQLFEELHPDRLLCEERLRSTLGDKIPEDVLVSFGDRSIDDLAMGDNTIREALLRLDRACHDESYLSLRKLALGRNLDRSLSVLAQGVLRDFAWRLPGYAHSNLDYLHRNFLDVVASLEDETERRVVRIGRPPLDLILSVTGMSRRSYCLSWLDTRPFALFPAS